MLFLPKIHPLGLTWWNIRHIQLKKSAHNLQKCQGYVNDKSKTLKETKRQPDTLCNHLDVAVNIGELWIKCLWKKYAEVYFFFNFGNCIEVWNYFRIENLTEHD